MSIGDKVYASKSFGYAGEQLDQRQVIELKGLRNDEKLLRHGLFKPLPDENTELYECGRCGAKFLTEDARTVHGVKRHAGEKEEPAEIVAP
jgi:hypothetical protein